MDMLGKLRTLTARIRQYLRHLYFALFLIPGQLIRSTALASNDGSSFLQPIFDFFSAIWGDLTSLFGNLTNAISSWFYAVWSFKYDNIPVGPLLFVGLTIGALFMLWGFMQIRRYLRTN